MISKELFRIVNFINVPIIYFPEFELYLNLRVNDYFMFIITLQSLYFLSSYHVLDI